MTLRPSRYRGEDAYPFAIHHRPEFAAQVPFDK